ncbi:HNH endonuclease [bacterium]|nr:HNH endonuclease [bacterium]
MAQTESFALESERTIARLVQSTCQSKAQAPMLGPPVFNEALSPPFVAVHLDYENPRIDDLRRELRENAEYYCVDFLDLIDFSTSGESGERLRFKFPKNGVTYVDRLSGSESDFDWKFGDSGVLIKGCTISSGYDETNDQQHLNIVMQLNWNPESDHRDIDQFFFCLHLFADEKGELSEFTRSHIYPPDVRPSKNGVVDWDEWMISFHGRMWEDYADWWRDALSDDDLPKKGKENLEGLISQVEKSKTWLYDGQIGEIFEMTRLMAFLPDYVDFMYDLVEEERRPVGGVERTSHRHGRVKKVIAFPEYRIIKSVKVRVEESSEGKTATRSWTAPSHSFVIRGHWRIHSNPEWVGHDPEGNEILGRTWVSSFRKGADFDELEEERHLVERDPNVVVKIKQTLAFGRDSIKAAELSPQPESEIWPTGSVEDPEVAIEASDHEDGEKPSAEWRFEERRKLSAGLRYLILRRDGFRCVLCGRNAPDDRVTLEVDHIRPIVKWGRTEVDNLRTLCRDCNRGRVGQ